MSVQLNPNAGGINWQAILSGLDSTSEAGSVKFSETDSSLVFTTKVNGSEASITIRIPDDLELPGNVDQAAIASLVSKLQDPTFGLTQDQVNAFKDAITKIYTDMADALAKTKSTTTNTVLFDLYKLMALLVEVAQSQRDAARDLRTAQSAQIQNSIQAQADSQRDAALVGLVVGVICGAISAIVSMSMLALQGSAYKNQLNAARTSGTDAAKANANMTKVADSAEHANAQLQKVEGRVGNDTATTVKGEVNTAVSQQERAFTKAKSELATKQGELTQAETELNQAQQARASKEAAYNGAKRTNAQARNAAGIDPDVKAEDAKANYIRECEQNDAPQDPEDIRKFDEAIRTERLEAQAKTELDNAPTEQAITQKREAVTAAKSAVKDAETKVELARGNYRAALRTTADTYTDKYNAAVAADGIDSPQAQAARKNMDMAHAFVESKLNAEGVTTAVDHRADVIAADKSVDKAVQRLNTNDDYRDALHNIERYTGFNAINTAINNMLQGMTQNIAGLINAEATRKSAEQEMEKEQLEQSKDLFNQAQGLIDAVVQLMNAVAAAESQSMRDAIQA